MDNKEIVRSLFSALDAHDFDKLKSLFAPHYKGHFPGAPENAGLDIRLGLSHVFSIGFPDLHHTLGVIISEGDFVAAQGVAQGTHQGDFQGIPATGKAIDIAWCGLIRFENGLIVEEWMNFDAMGMMQQIGVVPR